VAIMAAGSVPSSALPRALTSPSLPGLAFCGDLSTVSTYVNELRGLSGKAGGCWLATKYALVTHVGGQMVSYVVLVPFYTYREGC
jgi:fluoride ion exporter CrcB/FEX